MNLMPANTKESSEELSTETTAAEREAIKRSLFSPWAIAVTAVVSVIVVGGILLASQFSEQSYKRDLQIWQNKLEIIANSRAVDVERFIAGNFNELETLANNPSLKIYIAELKLQQQAKNPSSSQDVTGVEQSESVQKSYIRNLLLFAAQHGGFGNYDNLDSVSTNITGDSRGGIAVLDNSNMIVASTNISADTAERITEHAKTTTANKKSIIDLQKSGDGNLYMGFSVPIYAIQPEYGKNVQIGRIVGLKNIGRNLFDLLKQPSASEKSLETVMLRKSNNQYISPLIDGSAPLDKYMEDGLIKNKNQDSLADGFYGYDDYRGNHVISAVRSVSGTSWQVISKVNTAEAFADGNAYRASVAMVFALVVTVVALTVIAMWWYSYSKQAIMASAFFRKLANKAQAHEKLLELVSDYQPESIYMVDVNQNLHFANRAFSKTVGMLQENIIGKKLPDVVGAARAGLIAKECGAAHSSGEVLYTVQKTSESTGSDQNKKTERVIRSAYIPVSAIPIPSLPEKTAGVLVAEQDISEVFFERERRMDIMKQLIVTLVNLVDKRDPFAANHSLLVSQIAYQMAIDMGLDDVNAEATRTAATLMNIGKILVPKALLTKTSSLSDDEKVIISESMDAASELLKNIPFDGAVADIIRQWQEKWDGSGKLGLAGDNILVPARIIAVANAFIGMVSPRSWRDAMSIDAATRFLLEQSGTYFDRRAVIALINHIENQSGREWLEELMNDKVQPLFTQKIG